MRICWISGKLRDLYSFNIHLIGACGKLLHFQFAHKYLAQKFAITIFDFALSNGVATCINNYIIARGQNHVLKIQFIVTVRTLAALAFYYVREVEV